MSVIAVGNSHTGPQNASTVTFNKHQPGYQSTERGNRSDVMKIYIFVAQRVGESKVPVVALYTLDTVSTQDFLCAIKYITPLVFNLSE